MKEWVGLNGTQWKLSAGELRKTCNASVFGFKDTSEIEPVPGIVGQVRALKSIEYGLEVDSRGYNLFLSGPPGSGRVTAAKNLAAKKAAEMPAPDDWCYVFNFDDHDRPNVIQLPGGMGRRFARDIEHLTIRVWSVVPKAFNSEEFEAARNALLSQFYEATGQMYAELEATARKHGLSIARTQSGVTTVPLIDGRPLTIEEFAELTSDEKRELMEPAREVQEKVNESVRVYREMEKNLRERLRLLEQDMARKVLAPYFFTLFDSYRSHRKIVEYLEQMFFDMLENLDVFGDQEDGQNPLLLFKRLERRHILRRYRVNLVVDNADARHAPVVYETNPTYNRLFGSVEYEGEFGVLSTDFTKIRAGAFHRANGGYLILNFYDLIRSFMAWETLKRVLKNREITIESAMKSLSLGGGDTLQPEPIPLNVKVIIIGDPTVHYILRTHDEDFSKLFKIKAEFDTEMDRTESQLHQYAAFIACTVKDEHLLHFTPGAVARVVDYGTWMAEDQDKLSTQFNQLSDVICEASAWAAHTGKTVVEHEDVEHAIEQKIYRSNMIEEKIMEMIEDDLLMIDVTGERIGEINGLAVYSIGDYAFGKPSRITAKTFMGEKGLVNIERETRMSGRVHSKGVLTLNGYLGGKYAQDKPLSLSASVTFEQTYEGVDGDSASSTELYAIISSLAELPIRQGIAVTGSVNQNGEIQPIGGVNEKIEGFFKVCRIKGLNGQQGVMIPRRNVRNLMLSDEVVAAAEKGLFNIWAVETVDQGLELLTGVPAGELEASGEYTKDSVHYRANKRLWQMADSRRAGHDPSGRSREARAIRRMAARRER